MKKALLVLPVIAVAIAVGGPASSPADTNALGTCPDHYTPVPAFVVGEDRNGNGVICVKTTNDIIIHDDPNGVPYECNGTGGIGNADCPQAVDILDDIV